MCEVSRAELEKLLCPQLTPQILYCLDNSQQIIPLFHNKPISILNVNSSNPGVETEQKCDRVTLSLPLCQACVSWELIFDHTQLEMPPDFTFGDDFIPDMGSLKRLEIYSLENPESLLLVLQELFELYRYLYIAISTLWDNSVYFYIILFREFNYSKAVKQDRVSLELNMLKEAGINQFSVLSKDVPVRSQGGEGMFGRPYLYLELPLEVDFKRLPPTLIISDEDLSPPSLLIMFKPPSYTQASRYTILHTLSLFCNYVGPDKAHHF